MGDDAFGINRGTIVRMVEEIAEITRMGVEVAIVIGGGNIFRGVAGGSVGIDRATADYMGMLATVMNALALGDTMDKAGLTPRVMSAIGIERVVEPYVRPKALQYLEEGKPIINEEEVAALKPQSSNQSDADDSDVVKRIKELLDNYVRPAVEMDGGAIQFRSYDEGVVNLMLQGSCSGCPSSMITLKAGIEGMMKRMIPEVKEVVAEAE